MKDVKETVMKYVFLVCACASILAVILFRRAERRGKSFDLDEVGLAALRRGLGHRQRQNAVVVLRLDLILREVVADVITSLAGFADLLAQVAGVLPVLLFFLLLVAADGEVAVFQRNFDLVLLVAGGFDLQLVIGVRLLDVGLQILLFVQKHGFEEVVVEHVEQAHAGVIPFLQIIFHNGVLLLMGLKFGAVAVPFGPLHRSSLYI